MWEFCGKAQFPQSFGRIAGNSAEIASFHKIYKPGNLVKLRYFVQWIGSRYWHYCSFVYQVIHCNWTWMVYKMPEFTMKWWAMPWAGCLYHVQKIYYLWTETVKFKTKPQDVHTNLEKKLDKVWFIFVYGFQYKNSHLLFLREKKWW